jgi:hypothetical protein
MLSPPFHVRGEALGMGPGAGGRVQGVREHAGSRRNRERERERDRERERESERMGLDQAKGNREI